MEILPARRVFDAAASYRVHVTQAGHQYNFVPHTHRGFCELVYVREGCFDEVINGRHFVQAEGQLTLIREHDVHTLRGAGFTFINTAFRSSWWRELARLWDDREPVDRLLNAKYPARCRLPAGRRPAFETELRQLLAVQGDRASRLSFSRFLVTVLHDHLLTAGETPARCSRPEWLTAAAHWVEGMAPQIPTLTELIARCGRCREHVARSFRQHLGLTPSQYLNRQRLKQAVILLKQTNYPVLSVAFEVGFENVGYFHRLFREAYGTTPGEYRRRYGYRPPERRA